MPQRNAEIEAFLSWVAADYNDEIVNACRAMCNDLPLSEPLVPLRILQTAMNARHLVDGPLLAHTRTDSD